ncbi:MAG: YkgJ family cysteine cluster protein, partial [Bacillota bacterium]
SMQAPADDAAVFKPLHKQRYGRCEGCVNNCCKSNDIIVDRVAAEAIASRLGMGLRQFAANYLRLNDDLLFPEFRKRPCPFLINNRCTVYQERALICRLYLCSPMTDRLEKLRCAVSLAGEAALRQRLVELGLAPSSWQASALRSHLRARYQAGEIDPVRWHVEREQLELLLVRNPFADGADYTQVRLVDCCTDALWDKLMDPDASAWC